MGFSSARRVKEGARILYGEVQAVSYNPSGMPSLTVRPQSGADVSLDASFVTFATGINAHCGHDYRDDPLIASLQRLNPSFVPARTRKTFIFELDVGEDYLQRHLNREIYFVEYGSRHLNLEHAALIPKGRFLTVALIGKCVDEADLPREGRRIARDFLTLPQIDRIFPGIAEAPVTCACVPRMTVTTAGSPFADRCAFIGDAVGSRLNKDGLYSAYTTATQLAETVLVNGIDKQALVRGYGKTIKWLAADNRSGRMVFGLSRVAFTRPLVSRIVYQAFATECKVREQRSRPLSKVLWKIASGTADYREVLHDMCGYGVLRSILVGAAVTLRNLAFEGLFGLKWGEYGRYPTVVLREKREVLKGQLASSLGEELGGSSDFERMYTIKIRGSEQEIMEELADFGRPAARFVNLRFVNVRQIRGVPNQVGSVIRYRIPFFGLSSEMQLTKRVGFETLLYQVDERLVDKRETYFQRRTDQGRKPQARHLHVIPIQEGQGRRESASMGRCQVVVSRIRARHRVEPCPVHHQRRYRAELWTATRPIAGLSEPTAAHSHRRLLRGIVCINAHFSAIESETPFPKNGMTVSFGLPSFYSPAHTAGTHVRRRAQGLTRL